VSTVRVRGGSQAVTAEEARRLGVDESRPRRPAGCRDLFGSNPLAAPRPRPAEATAGQAITQEGEGTWYHHAHLPTTPARSNMLRCRSWCGASGGAWRCTGSARAGGAGVGSEEGGQGIAPPCRAGRASGRDLGGRHSPSVAGPARKTAAGSPARTHGAPSGPQVSPAGWGRRGPAPAPGRGCVASARVQKGYDVHIHDSHLVVRLEPGPVGDGAVLLGLLGQHALDAERLVGRLRLDRVGDINQRLTRSWTSCRKGRPHGPHGRPGKGRETIPCGPSPREADSRRGWDPFATLPRLRGGDCVIPTGDGRSRSGSDPPRALVAPAVAG